MPIYDHICDHCGHAFSVVRAYSDPPVEKCPNCGKQPRRVLTAPAIVFKGSGWYKTDSRASSAAAKDRAKAGDAKGDAKSDTKGGEAKPSEPKPATKDAAPA